MGIKMTSTTEMSFDQVRVPEENLIGNFNKGFYQVIEFFDESRVMVAAQALGIAQELLIGQSIMLRNENSLARSWRSSR